MFPMSPPHCQGGGAQSVVDGHDTYGSQPTLGTGVPAVEIEESTAPMMVLWRRIATNSGGAGYHTGGHGISMGIAIAGSDEMSGTAFNTVAEVVPGGFAGGMPGGASDYMIFRDSNVPTLLEAGQLPSPDRLDGAVDHPPAKTGSLRVREWDTFVFTSSGGGGLGDPLLRPPAAVADDLRNEFITASAAADLFGVTIGDDGAVDEPATESRRRDLRATRIGRVPPAEAGSASGSGISVTDSLAVGPGHRDGRWVCAHCNEDLGPMEENFRDRAVLIAQPAADLYAAYGMQIRRRPDGEPQVVLQSYFCPTCAYAVTVDVNLEGCDVVPSPVVETVS
jgi:N-methylhydantoinase B